MNAYHETEEELIIEVRELVNALVDDRLQFDYCPFANLIREKLLSIEAEMNENKRRLQRIQSLHHFIIQDVKTLVEQSAELKEALTKFPKLESEEDSSYNQRILNLATGYINSGPGITTEQFLAFIKIERAMDEFISEQQSTRPPVNRKLF